MRPSWCLFKWGRAEESPRSDATVKAIFQLDKSAREELKRKGKITGMVQLSPHGHVRLNASTEAENTNNM